MYISQIRDAAAAEILKQHPELEGLVSFDAQAFDPSPMVSGIDLIINLHGSEAWTELQSRTGRDEDFTNLDKLLDHFRFETGEGQFVIGKHQWLIGDGDDHGALRIEGHVARLWVRTWWEMAE
jgi:hypothetical protein